jgi:hypothetical protein
MPFRSLTLLLIALPMMADGPALEQPRTLVDQYVAATQVQKERLQGTSMEVEIEAELPKLKKKGHLFAIRKIASLGRITYDAIRFDGDKTIRNQVIARYMAAETETSQHDGESLAITPANYKFKYKGSKELHGRRAHLFEVKPHRKRAGLYRGELWVDSETYLPLREAGRLVKTPSIFLKRVDFVRDYRIEGDLALPERLQSEVDTRIAGKAILTIAYHLPASPSSDLPADALVSQSQ